ncbi:TIGR02300 family protein [Ancylobacter defluvii]|uniref:TIGR02300 family protein n=1 Tax=Ancylobacter defluvii TaxID=1282440 RepID=UPI001BCE6E38|nr:TIGR02300 family protein [Ancylobacter defluvii]MBS7588888.1 TIGR02300 family protein [Ancylobacter defluvii]
MVKPELGTKRVCPVTGRKFYDLNKDPVISPYTGQIVPITAPITRGRPEPSRPAETPAENEAEEAEDVELVSLEDADEEAASPAKAATSDDDIEIDDEVDADGDEDDTFLEEDEDDGDDVTDLIGDGLEDDEEG